jgi:hypothetical protein
LSHSSTFWRKSRSTECWPAETQHGRALERRRHAGRSAGLAAPRDVNRPPRRLGVCAGPFPTTSSHKPPIPSRARLLGRCVVRVAPYSSTSSCPAVCRRFPVHASRRRSSYRGIESDVLSLRPAYKGRASAITAQAAAPAVHASARRREPPLSANTAAGQHFLQPPKTPYNLPVPPLPLPRLRVRRSRARCGHAPCAPPAGQLSALLCPSSATNWLLVSPTSFPTLSPTKPATGAAQFWPEPPPPWTRTTLHLPHSFQGLFCESGTYL